MKFRLCGNGGNLGGGEWIAAEGEITRKTPDEFSAFIGNRITPVDVCLDSPGGDLMGGIKLGEFIREKGFSTRVGKTVPDGYRWWMTTAGTCASAGAFAFIGGVTRDAESGEVGVHQFYDEVARQKPFEKLFDANDVAAYQAMTGLLVDFSSRMGVDPRLVSLSTATLPEKMHFLTEDELNNLRVRWQPKEFEPWVVEPRDEGAVAISTSRDKSLEAEIFCRGGVARLRLQSSTFLDTQWTLDALSVLGSLEVFDHRFSRELLSLVEDRGRPCLEIEMPGFDLSWISATNLIAVATDDGPRYMWSAFCFDLPRREAIRPIRLALRNPIDGSA